jgi:RNA polymerase sigma factor (sigma-70 family)
VAFKMVEMKTTSTDRVTALGNPVSTGKYESQICVQNLAQKVFPKRGVVAFKKMKTEKSQQQKNNIMNTAVPINVHEGSNQRNLHCGAACNAAGRSLEVAIEAARQHFFDHEIELQERHWSFALARARRAGVSEPVVMASKLMASLRRTYDPALPFEPYFNKAVRHRIASALRTDRATSQREVPLTEHIDLTCAHERPASVSEDLKAAVDKALRKLRPQTRELFLLRFWRGHDCAGVARIVGLTKSAVINRMSRAYKRLRPLLAEWSQASRAVESAASVKPGQRPVAAVRQAPAPSSSAGGCARRGRRPGLAAITPPVRNKTIPRCLPQQAA